MHVALLSLTDFRNYRTAELSFEPGATVIVGRNGQGKTNLVEAVGTSPRSDRTASPATRR